MARFTAAKAACYSGPHTNACEPYSKSVKGATMVAYPAMYVE